MNKELEIWQFAAERLKRNESVMLLVVAESSGSSPGRQGFKMIIAEDEMRGSIGGGVMEVELVERAKSQIANHKSQIIEQVHQKNSPHASGMICSGRQTVIFFKLNLNHLPVVREIANLIENHESKVLRITENEFAVKDIQSSASNFKFEREDETRFSFEESIGCKNKLFIVGGGHCALALSELMAKMDFHISLYDDRPNLNTLDKNKYAHRKIILESYEKIDDFIAPGANHFVVVMTLGYKTDAIVIQRLIDKDFKYFGVLGSRAKMATLFRELKKAGFSEEKISQIHAPVGLPINSRTPVEIAVSIAAEIIAVKNASA
jgi:xanthine dehydrogenase accessory factor